MSLLKEFFTACQFITPMRTDDGLGGSQTVFINGSLFDAAIRKDNSVPAKIAQKQGVTDVYTITTRRDLNLQFHEVFRRLSDGKIFRVTSNGDDDKTPQSAGLDMRQVAAEEWTLPRV